MVLIGIYSVRAFILLIGVSKIARAQCKLNRSKNSKELLLVPVAILALQRQKNLSKNTLMDAEIQKLALYV